MRYFETSAAYLRYNVEVLNNVKLEIDARIF